MPAAPRSPAASFFASGRLPLTFGAALTFTVVALQIASRHKPWDPFAPVALSNQLIATAGLAWAALQMRTYRRDAARLRAWASAGLGMAALALEDNVGRLISFGHHAVVELAVTIALWLVAAALIFSCGRAYAMRRSVMETMQTALAIQLATHAFALVALTSAPLRSHTHATLIDLVAETGELMAALGYVFALLLTAFAPFKSYARPLERLGAKARDAFCDFGLAGRPRYPTPYPLLQRPVLRELTTVAMALWFAPRAHASAREDGGGSLARQAIGIARLAFGRGVDPLSYYLLRLYRPGGPDAADAALTRAETKNGLNKAIQNLRAGAGGERELNDKLAFWRICRREGIACAPILALAENGAVEIMDGAESFDRDLFVKDRKGRGGKFTLTFRRVARFRYADDAGRRIGFAEALDRLGALSATRPLIVQPKLANHASVAGLARDSLVVFRVVTCLDERDEPRATHVVLRILRRFEPSWPKEPENEWGAAVDLGTGRLGRLTGDVAETCGRRRERHPVTGAVVAGTRPGCVNDVVELALRAHRVFRARVLIGWDVAATPDGPRLLEGNNNMDVAFIQRCYATPVGLSPLGPLLDRRIDQLVAARVDACERAETRRPAPAGRV